MARDDRGIVAVFRNDIVKNESKSIEAGRPIFDDIELVEMRYPGSKNIGVFPAMEFSHWDEDEINGGQRAYTYAERFARQYQQFKAHQQQTKSGTPLDYLPFLTEAKRAELRALNIYTAEALTIDRRAGAEESRSRRARLEEPSHRVSGKQQRDGTHQQAGGRAGGDAGAQSGAGGRPQGRPAVQEPSNEFDGMTDEQLREHIKSLTGVDAERQSVTADAAAHGAGAKGQRRGMSILSVVKDVCFAVGLNPPSSMFASSVQPRTQAELLSLANEMAQRIAYDVREWTALKAIATLHRRRRGGPLCAAGRTTSACC